MYSKSSRLHVYTGYVQVCVTVKYEQFLCIQFSFFAMKIAKKDARRFDVNNYVIIMVHVT